MFHFFAQFEQLILVRFQVHIQCLHRVEFQKANVAPKGGAFLLVNFGVGS